MSKYEIDKALWQFIGDPGTREALRDRPEAFFDGRDLTDAERRAIEACDIRALYMMGAIPFLIYQFAIARAGRLDFDLGREYVGKLRGCEPADITT